MKNIAILVPNLKSGGAERIASRLSTLLCEKYNLFMVLFDSEGISYKYGGTLVDMKLPAVKGKIGKVFNMLKRIKALRKLIKKEKIDVVCSFTAAADNVNAFCGSKAKRLVSCRAAAFLEKNMQLYRKMCRASDGILFNSAEMKEMYLEKYPDDREKCYFLQNLYDIENIICKAQEPVDDEIQSFLETHKTVITVGRFVVEKGHWNLLKAFEILKKKVPDAGLLFVGHMGAFEEDIRKMASESCYGEDIKFAGFSDNPFKFSAKSAVFALSSLNEGSPNALVEAMAAGAPVVSTNCKTGPKEILFDKIPENLREDTYTIGDYGIITPPFSKLPDFNLNTTDKTHEIFAEALETMLTDNELSLRLKTAAREKVRELDWKVMIKKYEELFKTL